MSRIREIRIVAVSSLNSSPSTGFEPFGQTGVRQYLFPVLTVLSLTCMVLSLGMWVRSHFIVDQFLTERDERRWYVSSIYGRILVAWGDESVYPAPQGEWMYRQYPIPENIEANDRWEPSLLKIIGLEWRFTPIDSSWGTRGGWLRVRWPSIAALWAVLPAIRIVREHRRKRAVRRLERGQCPR